MPEGEPAPVTQPDLKLSVLSVGREGRSGNEGQSQAVDRPTDSQRSGRSVTRKREFLDYLSNIQDAAQISHSSLQA